MYLSLSERCIIIFDIITIIIVTVVVIIIFVKSAEALQRFLQVPFHDYKYTVNVGEDCIRVTGTGCS